MKYRVIATLVLLVGLAAAAFFSSNSTSNEPSNTGDPGIVLPR